MATRSGKVRQRRVGPARPFRHAFFGPERVQAFDGPTGTRAMSNGQSKWVKRAAGGDDAAFAIVVHERKQDNQEPAR